MTKKEVLTETVHHILYPKRFVMNDEGGLEEVLPFIEIEYDVILNKLWEEAEWEEEHVIRIVRRA